MRSEQEMMDLIVGFAQDHPGIRAVYMNGSRTNPDARVDPFQDYDIVYVVTEVAPFVTDKSWLSHFGEICVMQEPDATALPYETQKREDGYAYLMQFEDGNRIDLTIQSISAMRFAYLQDSLTKPILDKDGLLPAIPAPHDGQYHVHAPDSEQYRSCCNEFWWVSPYIAKGLWRGEILYAMAHLETCVRPMLQMMLTWEAGVRNEFSISAGKCGKYLDHFLPPDKWGRLLKTYPVAEEEAVWHALFDSGALFRDTAEYVADACGFSYDREEDRRTTAFLRDVHLLPRDAKVIHRFCPMERGDISLPSSEG